MHGERVFYVKSFPSVLRFVIANVAALVHAPNNGFTVWKYFLYVIRLYANQLSVLRSRRILYTYILKCNWELDIAIMDVRWMAEPERCWRLRTGGRLSVNGFELRLTGRCEAFEDEGEYRWRWYSRLRWVCGGRFDIATNFVRIFKAEWICWCMASPASTVRSGGVNKGRDARIHPPQS